MEPSDVRVEVVDLDEMRAAKASGGAADGGLAGVLDASERARAAALRDPADRRRYVTAHSWLRRRLGEATGVEARAVVILRSPCSSCGQAHGKPFVGDGPSFSFTRTGRWAALALADDDAVVGVDLEGAQDPARLAQLRDTLLAPGENSDDLLRTWVRKEALLKASGEGLNRPMTEVRADDDRVRDLELPAGLVGALAVFTDASRPSTKVRRR